MAERDVPEHNAVPGRDADMSLSDVPLSPPANNGEASVIKTEETITSLEETVPSTPPNAPTDDEPSSAPDNAKEIPEEIGEQSEDPEPHQGVPVEQPPSIPKITNSDVEAEGAPIENPAHPSPAPDRVEGRERSDSRSTVATQATTRSTPISSVVFVVTALDTIAASKEARRSKELDEAVKLALGNIKHSDQHPIDPEVIFRPLELASKAVSIPLQITALDCIGKLITYSYFAFPSSSGESTPDSENQPPLIERAIEAICDCFENEATPPEIQQQIIKSLLAAVLNDKIVVHGAGLLKAVRQIYNIFIYSKSSQNQHIAQGSLTQMIGTVYDRVRVRLDLKEARLREVENFRNRAVSDVSLNQPGDATPTGHDESPENESSPVSDQPVAKEPREKLTLQSFETSKDEAVVNDNAPTMVTRAKVSRKQSRSISGDDLDPSIDDEDEIYVKDAFLVFRALCKLSHKILSHEQQQDLKSHNMRSKLLSLHLMQHLLSNHISVFTSPLATIKSSANSSDTMTLLQAIRPHLCLSLSRNGASSVPRVFEVCCEIFWLMLKHMRVMLKVSLLRC